MFQEERLLEILGYLRKHQVMSVHEICEIFGVSRDTARRDILKLIEQGAAIRTHGGITLPVLKETIEAYRERLAFHSKEKNAIGKKAAAYIQEGKHYFFDVSTTVNFLAEHLDVAASICTHALDISDILSKKDIGTVFLLGGQLNKKNRFFFDHETIQQLRSFRFDAAFMGAAAITESGIYYADKEDAYAKQTAASCSKEVFLLADVQKFGRDGYYLGLHWDNIHGIITDQAPPEEFLSIIRSHRIELIIADE